MTSCGGLTSEWLHSSGSPYLLALHVGNTIIPYSVSQSAEQLRNMLSTLLFLIPKCYHTEIFFSGYISQLIILIAILYMYLSNYSILSIAQAIKSFWSTGISNCHTNYPNYRSRSIQNFFIFRGRWQSIDELITATLTNRCASVSGWNGSLGHDCTNKEVLVVVTHD